MPRRLDPKKGLPGLFERGRSKSEDMAFLSPGKAAPRTRAKKPKPPIMSVPAATGTETASESAAPMIVLEARPRDPSPPAPTADPELAYVLAHAAPPRRVPVAPQLEPLTLRELPALAACAFDWARHTLRAFARRD